MGERRSFGELSARQGCDRLQEGFPSAVSESRFTPQKNSKPPSPWAKCTRSVPSCLPLNNLLLASGSFSTENSKRQGYKARSPAWVVTSFLGGSEAADICSVTRLAGECSRLPGLCRPHSVSAPRPAINFAPKPYSCPSPPQFSPTPYVFQSCLCPKTRPLPFPSVPRWARYSPQHCTSTRSLAEPRKRTPPSKAVLERTVPYKEVFSPSAAVERSFFLRLVKCMISSLNLGFLCLFSSFQIY